MSLPLWVLDLAPVAAGSTAAEALGRTVELARAAERLGFTRYWLAEHHGMPSIASSAPEILIGHVAAATERIRVGSGGIMLPNHVPLQVAERFYTLAALHPGRIDLGIGRAPGTDPATVRALRPFPAERFAELLGELVTLSGGGYPADHPFGSVRVVPSDVPLPPVWLLGSSGASASLAGLLGMGYSFARHFSPSPPGPALQAYREAFRPSAEFPRPHAILAVSAVCADTPQEAVRLASSMELAWVRLRRGELRPLPSPEEALVYPYSPSAQAVVEGYRRLVFVGTAEEVREGMERVAFQAGADEIMVTTTVYDPEARLRSFELLAGAAVSAGEGRV